MNTPYASKSQVPISILYADAPGNDLGDQRKRESFSVDLDRLAARHAGCIDPFGDAAGVVFFTDAASCVRMAMDLQRTAGNLHLRIGVHTGSCDMGAFRDGDALRAVIEHEARIAANIAVTAAIGSIAISPETYVLVKDVIETDASGCLLMEEMVESHLGQISLTPTPARGAEHGLSTFAGLGR
jgi:class 3 adenylate cyclase